MPIQNKTQPQPQNRTQPQAQNRIYNQYMPDGMNMQNQIDFNPPVSSERQSQCSSQDYEQNNQVVADFNGMMGSMEPETLQSAEYLPGYLATQLGKFVKADFLIGGCVFSKIGTLKKIGANYFLLDEEARGVEIVCDLYSLKFVAILLDPNPNAFFIE